MIEDLKYRGAQPAELCVDLQLNDCLVPQPFSWCMLIVFRVVYLRQANVTRKCYQGGQTWLTGCYLECYLYLGVTWSFTWFYLGVTWVVILNTRVPQTFEEEKITWRCYLVPRLFLSPSRMAHINEIS